MGATCTRDCGFCRVAHGKPGALDAAEPGNVALAAKTLGLRHIVITSVTRDDLPLGGARHFAETITVCKELSPHATIEVLIPDFNGSGDALETVLAAAPTILNHNLETVPRLYSKVRPQADVERSLELLSKAHRKNFITKSGIMVGLGETEDEVFRLLTRLKKVGCKIVTIGQYLRPSALQLPIVEFVTPEQFTRYEQKGNELGFLSTLTGPFVRSSYRAGEVFSQA
jgi:lipoic acid synthetase